MLCMEAAAKERRKRNLTVKKAWKRWVAWVARKKDERKVREGCFSVCVGEERERFKVKTELANHPSFKKLLDDAEMEYGFVRDGPIWLPCNVEVFFKVMAEMDAEEEEEEEEEDEDEDESSASGSFSKVFSASSSFASFAMCSPSRLLFNKSFAHQDHDDHPRCAYELLPSK